MRYLFGVFPEIHDVHFKMISDPRNELKMEVWHSDFDRNLNVILDRLHLMDSPENRKRLKRNGLFDVDITAERDRLYSMMKTQDTSQVEGAEDNGIGHIERRYGGEGWKDMLQRHEDLVIRYGHGTNKRQLQGDSEEGEWIKVQHVHTARNDTQYIDALLTIDTQICLVLKHITELISYGWLYPQYC